MPDNPMELLAAACLARRALTWCNFGEVAQPGRSVVLVTRVLLRIVDALVDFLVVLVAGSLVDLVAGLLQSLVDLLVVLVGEVLGFVHEVVHGRAVPTGHRGMRQPSTPF